MNSIFPFDEESFAHMQAWVEHRILSEPDPYYGARTAVELEADLIGSISSNGHGSKEAFRRFTDVIIPSIRAQHHPTNLAYIPAAPTPASLAFDSVLGSAEIFGGTWEAGSGAIHAENQVLSWLSECAGFPADAGGVFVSGGTMGNLSALHAARNKRAKETNQRPERWAILASTEAHSSIQAVANVMDVELVLTPVDAQGQIDIEAATSAIDDPSRFFAIIGNAGSTNAGAVDDLAALAKLAQSHGLWLHVDGAFGLAAIVNPQARQTFAGLEHADSFIVDPHKWLFAPYDCCALVYRRPSDATAAHAQKAVYLDPIQKSNWNPADYAVHLSRRARGLPLWFSLVSYGSDAYSRAIATCIQTAQKLAEAINASDKLDLLLCSKLSILLFRPKTMNDDEIDAWADTNREAGSILCMPTQWRRQKVLRICIVNPECDPVVIMDRLKELR